MNIVYSFCFELFGHALVREDGSFFYWSYKTSSEHVALVEEELQKKYPGLTIVRAQKSDPTSNLCFQRLRNRIGPNPSETLDLWTWNSF